MRFLATATLKEYLSEQQLGLLTSYNCFTCRLVKPGGILIYSTCSIDPEENENRITSFVQRHPVLFITTSMDFSVEVINSVLNLSYKNMSVLNIRRLLELLSLCIVFPLK